MEYPAGIIQVCTRGQRYSHVRRVPIDQLARPLAETVRDATALSARFGPWVVATGRGYDLILRTLPHGVEMRPASVRLDTADGTNMPPW